MYRDITLGLAGLNLTLSAQNGFDTGNPQDDNEGNGIGAGTIVLIIATTFLALMLAFLGVTYWIRVTK